MTLCKNEIRALSKKFGHIPDVPIFTQWDKRVDCAKTGVHRHNMSGISGTSTAGVYSLALSNSYPDDEDGGDVIIYSGQGGKKRLSDTTPPKRLRCGPQTEDQSWDKSANRALIISSLTGNPVRVVRSWKCPSQYAPFQGYRYDGLYKVTACWTGKSCRGLRVCRCRLERLPDQPPIPVRPIALSASRSPRGRLVDPTPCHSTSAMSCARSTGDGQQQGLSRPVVLPIYQWHPKERALVRLEQPPRGDASEQTETEAFSNGGD